MEGLSSWHRLEKWTETVYANLPSGPLPYPPGTMPGLYRTSLLYRLSLPGMASVIGLTGGFPLSRE